MTGSNNHNDSNHNHSNNNNNNDNNNNNKFLQSKQQQQHFDNNNHGITSPWANRRAPFNCTTSRKRITKKGMVRVQMILSASIFLVFLNVAVLLHRHSTIDNTANSLHDVLPNFAMTAELEAKGREEPRQQEEKEATRAAEKAEREAAQKPIDEQYQRDKEAREQAIVEKRNRQKLLAAQQEAMERQDEATRVAKDKQRIETKMKEIKAFAKIKAREQKLRKEIDAAEEKAQEQIDRETELQKAKLRKQHLEDQEQQARKQDDSKITLDQESVRMVQELQEQAKEKKSLEDAKEAAVRSAHQKAEIIQKEALKKQQLLEAQIASESAQAQLDQARATARAEEVLQEALEEGQKLGQIVLDNERREQNANANTNHTPYVSLVVVLTDHNKTSNVLAGLLPSILQQQQPYHQHQGYLFNFEIVIVDASCHDDSFLNRDIQRFLEHTTLNPRKIRHTYVQACDTPGYAVLANRAVANTAASSQFILLLNEHVVLQNETFVQSMVELVEAKHNAAAVGCKLLTKNSDTLIEAGGILWSDASTTSFGVDRTDLDAPEFLFPRPVDYVSGACLMVNKTIFQEYGGFEGNSQQLLSSNQHYQELDLQTHIQHDLHMEVWVQPSAVVTHADPASVGNGDNNKNKSLRHSNAGPFQEKWKEYLVHHPPTPSYHNLSNHSRHVELLKASDLRARDPTKARILYLDQLIPNQNMGRGFGRAFDNLSMLAELGHRITAMAMEVPTEKWCDAACLEETRRLGIEVVTTTPWEEFTTARVGFYDIVLVSRPSTFARTYKKWREFYKQSPFAIVYDCEALWYRRDIDMLNLYKEGIQFPSIGAVNENYIPVKELMTSEQKTSEETILKLADIIVPVSEKEADIIADLVPGGNIQAIGHVMKLPDRKSVPFQKRKGILFLASFNNDMYYNGDAIWYFLKETYPLVLKDSPIPLSIAGHDIPEKLRNFTRDNGLDDHVTFFESLVDTTPLFDNARVFIAPHLYGSGIQFKLSECLSMGIATVMSKLSADAFGIKPDDHIACVGDTPESFKSCVLSVHNNETMWNTMRHNGLEFIKRTHSQKHVQELWKKVIDNGKAIFKEIQVDEIAAKSNPPPAEFKCPEGEERYKEMYSDVAVALQKVKKTKYTKANRMQEKTGYSSAFDHWRQAGESEGRKYTCDYNAKLFKTEIWTTTPTGPCPVGEKLYQIQYPIVREMIETGKIRSGYREWLRYGKEKRRNYFCEDDLRALNLPEDSWVMQFIKG